MTPSQRLMRGVTALVVRAPVLWRPLRGLVARNFDRLAPEWDASRVSPDRLAPLAAALAAVGVPPRRVLDVGTGSGAAARLAAERWPEAEVVGVDLSPAMVAEARRLAGSPRERYEVADAAKLPFADGAFDLVLLNNMIPFFDELARVTAPDGCAVVAFALGDRTPIWVPPERVRAELERRGFAHAADFSAGAGVALLARRRTVS
ncbi:MAG TPA: class I SAM-dependent methyltransferase [Gaiellaceae bacterium]|nr:class I SAM-dependent methyltransferase [Gaiellaceae bacterium]